jgi:hypothetical protein
MFECGPINRRQLAESVPGCFGRRQRFLMSAHFGRPDAEVV